MFVSGNDNSGFGMVTVNDQDAGDVPITEFCENTNKFSINSDCACPSNFQPYSSSTMVEFEVGHDRPTYCVGKEAEDIVANQDPKPLDGCKKEWERQYTLDGQKFCSTIVFEICKSSEGRSIQKRIGASILGTVSLEEVFKLALAIIK